MIEYIIPVLAGICLGVAGTLIITRRVNISGDVAQQAIIVLSTIYTSLADDGKLSNAERAALAEEVRKLIELMKNTTTETT